MSIGLKANSDGSGAIQIGGSDAITITTGLNTTFAGTAAVPTGTLYPLVSGTAVASTSGTSIDFTGIPSWVKRITVILNGVSLSGSAFLLIQVGTSGGVVTSGYTSSSSLIEGTAATTSSSTAGFLTRANTAAALTYGHLVITNVTGNNWISSHTMFCDTTVDYNIFGAGSTLSALSSTLDRVRITSSNGTDTFDAGSINILYE